MRLSVQHLVHDIILPRLLPAHLAHLARPTGWPDFDSGVYPLSSLSSVATAAALYLSIIFGIQHLLTTSKKPILLSSLFQAHNLLLSLSSLLLLLLMLEDVIPLVLTSGPLPSVCATESFTKRLEVYYIVNYYFKYYELFDTLFLVLRKKKLEFLHVFHHAATAALCYTQLWGRTSVSWFPITLNLLVHVFMYYYYWMASMGKRVWWKKHLTTMQITQFVLDLIVVYSCLYVFVSNKYMREVSWAPQFGDCAGREVAGWFGAGILSSYLVLFIQFYLKTYYAKKGGVAGDDVTKKLKATKEQ